MLFPTITFAIFFLVVYVLNWLLMPRLRLWKWFIIAASYVFYGWWDWRLVFLLVAATLVNQGLGVQVHRSRGRRGKTAAARRWVILAVAANLITLGVFKYFDFFA
ncbi:MAG TPA: MBOAT family protein, partial [Rhodospirillales bacterium]|nr:MBOAT family protein [Rhodospirillales bacterium]